MSKWWITIPVVTNSFFCFLSQILHFTGVCVVHSRVCCSAEFCSPYVHSVGTWAHHAAVAAAELGVLQRRGNRGLYCPFLWSAVVCPSTSRTSVVRVENRFSQLDTTSLRWISEFVKCLVEIQGEVSVECKVIMMKVLMKCWGVRGAGQSLRADLSLLSVYYRSVGPTLVLLTLTARVERVSMGIIEPMSWRSIIPQTDFALHSLQLLGGKHDFYQK